MMKKNHQSLSASPVDEPLRSSIGAPSTIKRMNYRLSNLIRLTAGAALLSAASLSAQLAHRYSFTSDANDSVGAAHGSAAQRRGVDGPIGNPVTFDGGMAALD